MLAMKHVICSLPDDKVQKEAAPLLERLRETVLCNCPKEMSILLRRSWELQMKANLRAQKSDRPAADTSTAITHSSDT